MQKQPSKSDGCFLSMPGNPDIIGFPGFFSAKAATFGNGVSEKGFCRFFRFFQPFYDLFRGNIVTL